MIPAEAFPPPDVLIDRRQFAAKYHNVHGESHPRPWSHITGICLHQTACDMGERVERYDTLGAHFGVLRSGRVLYVHDIQNLIWHGNAWNNGTVGIEINGLFEGVLGDPKTVWDDPTTKVHEIGQRVTPDQIVATKQLVRWICSEVAKNGGEIRVLVAHRQSSKDRRDDPGSEVWQTVALPLHSELGLTDGGVGFVVGGLPIPEAWDSRCKGIKY
jgi:N-acetyl-anhydromuramyl-L-alanine amidase AmpD